jgi:hypothetical protein
VCIAAAVEGRKNDDQINSELDTRGTV